MAGPTTTSPMTTRAVDPTTAVRNKNGMTPSNYDLAAEIRHLYDFSRNIRRLRVDRWQRAYRLVHNAAWSPLREAWLPSPSASEIYPILAALVGWMTDIRPGIQVLPAMNPGTPIAQQLQQLSQDLAVAMQANEINNEEDREIEKVLWDGMMYGTGFLKTWWDPAAADGYGDARTTRVDPFAIYPDPAGHTLDDCNYIIEVRRMSIQELDRRFPGTAKKLGQAAGVRYESIDYRHDPLGPSGRVPMSNTGAFSPVTAPLWGLPGQGRKGIGEPSMLRDAGVTVFECWMREHFVVKSEQEGDPDRVNDRWRVIIMAANEILVDMYAEDIYAHKCHPYSRYVLTDFGEFWGIALLDHLAPLQVALNRLLAALQSHAELTGNPVFLEPANSGIPRTRITNRPGQRLTTSSNASTQPSWMQPPDMPAGVTNLIQFYISEMERISGLSALVRGMQPQGRNSEGVIDSVQEAAFVRVRLALRSLESTLRDAGRKKASLITEFYTEPRMVSIVGDSGTTTTQAFHKNHFYARDLGDKDMTPFRYSILVQAGGTQPLSREKRSKDATTLFAMGGIDRVALLEAFDYPNRDAINQRIAQQEAVGAFNPPGARQRTGRTR